MERLKDDLDCYDAGPVRLQRDEAEPYVISIIGKTLRLRCKKTGDGNAWEIMRISTPNHAQLDHDKELAMNYRALWDIRPNSGHFSPDHGIASLIEQLDRFEENKTLENKGRERKAYLRQWEEYLERQPQEVSDSGLQYTHHEVHDAHIQQFTLSPPPPPRLELDRGYSTGRSSSR